MKKVVLLFSAATLVLASCNNDLSNDNNNGRVALKASAAIAETRAANNSWDAGDEIGIFMLDNTGTLLANKKYKADATGSTSVGFSPTAPDQTIYFPVDNSAPQVDFVAYYPYSSTQTGLTYNVSTASQTNQSALDLIVADKVTGKDKNAPAVSLTFKHRLTKLELILSAGTGLTEADLAGLTVAVTGFHTTASCDLNTGVVTASGSTADITLLTATNGKKSEATLIPAGAAAGRELVFELSSAEPFVYEIPDTREFNPGEKHVYTITLNRTGAEVSAQIVDWIQKDATGVAN